MTSAHKIKSYGNELGIDEIKITTAEPFTQQSRRILEQKNDGLFLQSDYWYKRNTESFCNVHTKLPGARSIIAACQCYLTDEQSDLSKKGNPHGLIARYTWRNYYLDLKKRLRKIGEFLSREYHAAFRVFSNGPVAEKPAAQRSGLGYFGKHSIIINKTYGSWIVLGELVTDIEIEPDSPLYTNCGACQMCIEHCPTKALIRPYILDRRKCIQSLTNWYGIIPDDIMQVWGNRLYGCTVCHEICPVNKTVKPRKPRTDLGYVGPSLPLIDILNMAENEYRSKYPNNQITTHWINFKAIKRNALIALGNIKDRTTLPSLKEFARSQDKVFSKTAQWALKQFSNG
jgi:epoxyqueuosine reductase